MAAGGGARLSWARREGEEKIEKRGGGGDLGASGPWIGSRSLAEAPQ